MDEIKSRLKAQEEYDEKILTVLDKEQEPIRERYKEIVREKPIYISDDCGISYDAPQLLDRAANLGAPSDRDWETQ